MSEVLVGIHNVSKRFCRDFQLSIRYGMRDIIRDLSGISDDVKKLRRGEFWALKGVGFEAMRGEILGLVGYNGSGKSTILKMITGIYRPDRGSLAVTGRVSSLIELGAGFHPLLSGEENIRVNGTILGLTGREISMRMGAIMEFSGLDRDLLAAPLQTYSSGMKARLGFSVAIHADPDVLLVDEVLAVGDVPFRRQCHERLQMLRDRMAIVLVSHDDQIITALCDRAVLLEQGELIMEDEVAKVMEEVVRRRKK